MWGICVLLLIVGQASSLVVPEQVHLSTQGDMTAMAVTWITFHKYASGSTKSYVIFGTSPNSLTLKNDTFRVTEWTDEGREKIVRYTHRVRMTNLKGGVRYYYRVGSNEGLSETFNFKMLDAKATSLNIIVYGDLGLNHGTSIDALKNAVKQRNIDIVFHIGDIAYDLEDDNGKVGDSFMKIMEPIAAYVPYMVIAGNHENNQHFQHFIHRFTTPITSKPERDNQFWSFDVGPVHFVGFSSEYYNYHMSKESADMAQWLQQDLANVKKPWIFGFLHRPMYCSAYCDSYENKVLRNGDGGYVPLEPLIATAGMDILYTGHKHYYERLFPLYKGLAFKPSDAKNIHNAKAPVHIVTGSAGCHTHISASEVKPLPFSAYVTDSYGFSVLEIRSAEEAYSYFVHAETGHEHDEWTLSKSAGYRPRIG